MREGWKREILKKVTVFISGKTVSNNIEKTSGEVIYTKVGDMNLEGNEVNITTSSRFVDFSDINENQIIPIGSVIFPKRGGAIATNKKRKIIKPTIVDLNTMAIAPSDKLFSEYLYYWFQSINLQELSNGTSIPQINNNSFDDVYIPYPISLQEQRQIVAILDENFKAIDQAKANIEKNMENAKELFQSKLNAIFSQKGDDPIAIGWEKKKFSEVLRMKSGEGLTAKKMIEGKYPVYGGNGIAGYHNKFNLKEENIIIGRVGALCGNVRFISEPIWLTDNAFKITEIKYDFDLEFLTYLLNFKDLRKLARQAAQPVISNSSVKDLFLEFPINLNEQISIRKSIKSLEEVSTKIVKPYLLKLQSLEELKKSILQKAFTGELTKTFTVNTKQLEVIPNN